MEWNTPDRLFVCLCKLSPEHSQRLSKLYDKGATLSLEVDAIRREHLYYTYGIAEKGILWAGGALGNFGGTLSIYAVNSVEEAERAKRDDPYYIKGYLYDDKYAEWFIHQPIGKASPRDRAKLEQGLREAGVVLPPPRKLDATIPERLFVCLSQQTEEHSRRLAGIYGGGPRVPIPPDIQAIRHKHLRYGLELGEKGTVWAAGPMGNHVGGLSIYSVNSMEEARKAKEGDPYAIAGFWYDYQYYEWFIHMPYSKLSAGHRDRIKEDLIRYGIIKD